jgi:formate hydrogenlyase subunit 6/NADH:ubiquinone oxidoreductase subunit I
MQLRWVWRGLRAGVVTTRYPARAEAMSPGWRGIAVLDRSRCRPEGAAPPCVRVCLPAALSLGDGDGGSPLRLDAAACIACGLCVDACPQGALSMSPAFELASSSRTRLIDDATVGRAESSRP